MTARHNRAMNATTALLQAALQVKKAAQWARDMNVEPSTFAQAKRRKHVSPEMAGYLAQELGLPADKWIAVAGLEATKDSPIKAQLLSRLQGQVLGALKSILASMKRRLPNRPLASLS